ncbi:MULTISPECIES: hypothetical protein [unclassified Pseudoalteromonas]|uniref:hypothetical protein n=1 Tax=unclassified Pseudoalteromonas TaxID=194690 RepID=UPI0020977D6F|nr:hypothetical protein [Pseudoalteromonas sp. XMcav2-N]MCO7191028.1 hypothetical protein [Pseudoalteromonas sp. XMcav2-N]
MKYLISMLLISVLFNLSAAKAHVLENNKARLTLRDGQAELRLQVNMQHWQHTLQNPQAWLLGDTTAVMPPNQSSQEIQSFIAHLLETMTKLHLNNTMVALQLKSLHTSKHHPEQAELILLGEHTHAGQTIEQVSLTLPPSLGPVHLSVTRPQYRMLSAGKTAHISFK